MMERRDVIDETWDLSCRSKQGANLEREVLDLSCKNLVAPTTTYEVTNTTACLPENLPANKQHQQSNLSEPLKSPFARIVMLSSSSEIDSLSKPTERCEPFFYNTNSEIRNAPYIQRLFHQTSSVMGTPLLRPVPLHLNNAMKVPVTITTSMATSSTSPSIPYAETSIQHQANDRTTEGTRLEFLNGPLTQVEMSTPPLSMIKKSPRPFKAYSKNSFPVLKRQIDLMSSSSYLQFRENVLKYRKMHESAPNPKMRRTSKSPALPTSTADEKNAAYLEKRKKNNEAAKRSRDNRRAKEDELAIWATFLEDDNTKLRSELAAAYCLMQERGIDLSQIKKN